MDNANGKTVLWAPGGTSRWYFMKQQKVGYSEQATFIAYGKAVRVRMLEIASMMFATGVETVFAVSFVPKQDQRTADYNENLKGAYSLLMDDEALEMYDGVSVRFIGGWEALFNQFGVSEMLATMQDVEEQTEGSQRRLVWYVPEHGFPQRLIEAIQKGITDIHDLRRAYYGFDISHIDILLGHNKPNIHGLVPPLLQVHDLYFNMTPSLSMTAEQWEDIMHDHLVERHGHFRDYKRLGDEVLNELQRYTESLDGWVLGVGKRHQDTQTWRPNWPDQPASSSATASIASSDDAKA